MPKLRAITTGLLAVLLWLGSNEVAWSVDQLFVPLPFWKYQDQFLVILTALALALIVVSIFRQRAARRLAQSERRLQEFFKTSQDGFYRSDIEGRITWVSPTVVKILGYEKLEDIIGQRIADHYADSEKRQLLLEQIQRTGKVTDYEVELRKQDGSTVVVSTSSAFYRDKSGHVLGVEGVFRDITERKLAERALKESELRYSSLVESTDIGIIAVDVHTREFLFVNKGMCRHLGFTQEEFLRQRIETMHPPDAVDNATRAFESLVSGRISVFSELPFLHKDGSLRYFDVTGVLLDFDGREAVIGYFRNVTESRLGKQALKDSEDLNRAVVEHSPIGVTVRSRTGKLLTYNEAWWKIWQVSDEDLHEYTTRERQELVFDERDSYLGDWIERVQQIYEEGGYLHIPEIETNVPSKQERLWLSHHFYALKDSSDRVDRVVVLTEDITDRKQAELATEQSRRQARAQYKGIPVPTYTWQKQADDFVLIDYNDAALEITKGTIVEKLGITLTELYGEDDAIRTEIIQCFNQKETIVREMKYKFKTTKLTRVLNVHYAYIPPDLVLVHTDDVTDRRHAEEALRESEERFRTLAEATPVSLVVTNAEDGTIMYANRAAEESLGYKQSELIGMKSVDLYLTPGDRAWALDILRKTGLVRNFETRIIRADGSHLWGLLSLSPITFHSAPAFFGSLVDITEHREAQHKLREAEEARYDQVKQIAGGVAHEIYNALFPATSCLAKLGDRLTESAPDDLERNRRLLELAESAVGRAIDMTDLVTRYSRLDSELVEEAVALRPLLEEIFESNAERIGDLGVKVQLAVADDVVVRCRADHLHSLFSNLLINALDALEEVSTRQIKLVASEDKERVQIRFLDTGPGIPVEHQPRVFEPFFSTKPTRGTGLGLAIVKRIVELYGGRIELEHVVDKGTIFVIFLKSARIDPSRGDN